MTESDHSVQELKRKRPKTHWIWYIGTVFASLIVGLSIAFAMQYTDKTLGATETTKTTNFAVIHSTDTTHAKLSLNQPSQTIKAAPNSHPVAATVSNSSSHSSVSTTSKTASNQQQKTPVVQKKQTTKPVTKPTQPHNPSKPNQEKESKPKPESKPNPPKQNPPSKTPDSPDVNNPPIDPPSHKGPIIRIVDRVTNTVEYLLTGKTKNN